MPSEDEELYYAAAGVSVACGEPGDPELLADADRAARGLPPRPAAATPPGGARGARRGRDGAGREEEEEGPGGGLLGWVAWAWGARAGAGARGGQRGAAQRGGWLSSVLGGWRLGGEGGEPHARGDGGGGQGGGARAPEAAAEAAGTTASGPGDAGLPDAGADEGQAGGLGAAGSAEPSVPAASESRAPVAAAPGGGDDGGGAGWTEQRPSVRRSRLIALLGPGELARDVGEVRAAWREHEEEYWRLREQSGEIEGEGGEYDEGGPYGDEGYGPYGY
jgi:hypothetical protein